MKITKSYLRTLIRESIEEVGVEEGKFAGQARTRLDQLIDDFRLATDPDSMEDTDPEQILADIASEYGQNIADIVSSGAEKMHYPRAGHTGGYDKLAGRQPVRVTKGGMANKQDVSSLKSKIKKGY